MTLDKTIKSQTYRITTECILRLRLLSVALSTPQSKLVELMINKLWEEKGEQVTSIVSSNRANKEASRILNYLKAK